MPESLAAPIIGAELRHRGKWPICSDYAPIFLFSQNTKGLLPHEKIGAHRIKASRFSSGFCSDFVLKGLAPISIFPHLLYELATAFLGD